MRWFDRDLADYLAANEHWRRTLRLAVRTDALLRQGAGRQQARQQTRYMMEARGQIRDQMRQQRRRAFRGDVSVSVAIFASGLPSPPSAPKSVKRYLDAMTGLVYRDDRQVAHLQVRRFADDDPYLRRRARGADMSAIDALVREIDDPPWVAIRITPVRIYAAAYDRAFALRNRRDSDWDSDPDELPFWESESDSGDDEELEQLMDERQDDVAGLGVYAIADDELVRGLRAVREARIGELLSKQILSRRPTAWDRPGGNPFALLGGVAPHPEETERFRVSLPGEFWLPGPEAADWGRLVPEKMREHRSRWGVLPAAFDEPLSLDIAAHGAAGHHRDIDNLAHPILAAFEALYCADRRGTVTAYRAYRLDTTKSGIRVRVMPGDRLAQLDDAIESARSYVLARGPRTADW